MYLIIFAIIAIIIGFLGKFTALISTIPGAVLGGVSLLLYGFIAVNGLKVLIKNQIDFENSKNIVVASSMLVIGLGGAAISIVSGNLSITISGMSLASIIGIILNLIIRTDTLDTKETIKIKREKISTDYNELKKEIKEEVLLELKEEIKNMKFIKVKKDPKTTPKKKKVK